MNYSSETINKLYYGDRLINISVTNGGGGGIPMPSNLSTATLNDYGSLTSAVIKSGVTSIGDNAFSDCHILRSVTVNATQPPMLNGMAFKNTLIQDGGGYIYVPEESLMDYQMQWNDYQSQIQAIPT